MNFLKNHGATEQLQAIMGDIVVCVSICPDNDMVPPWAENGRTDYFDLQYHTIMIEFSNGRKVVFSASEWAQIYDAESYGKDVMGSPL